jgi:hypothetical protein
VRIYFANYFAQHKTIILNEINLITTNKIKMTIIKQMKNLPNQILLNFRDFHIQQERISNGGGDTYRILVVKPEGKKPL